MLNKYLITSTLLLSLFVLLACEDYPPTPKNSTTSANTTTKEFVEEDLSYNGKPLVLTKHARCRMDCRFIEAYEINEVLQQNKINERKTKREAKPCPSIAYEGITRDGQHARVIIGACDQKSPVVITVIDLKNEYQCACK